MAHRLPLAARLVLPSIWLGVIIAIDLVEAPLKFQAPGITIPLGLGIGRLVFTGMNLIEALLAVLLAAALLRGPRPTRAATVTAGAIGALLLVKTLVIRPLLAAHTDAVLAGASGGGSMAHVGYIAIDAALFATLAVFIALQARGVRLEPAAPAGPAGRDAADDTPELAAPAPH